MLHVYALCTFLGCYQFRIELLFSCQFRTRNIMNFFIQELKCLTEVEVQNDLLLFLGPEKMNCQFWIRKIVDSQSRTSYLKGL